MTTLTIAKEIDAPVARVFDLCTDLNRWPERIRGIERVELLTDGPVGKGTRFRETRIMFKREATEEMEFTSFEPNERYTVGSYSCGCEFDTRYEFIPQGERTRLEMRMLIQPTTLFAKLMMPLGKLMAGSMRKACEKDLDDIKLAAESKTAS